MQLYWNDDAQTILCYHYPVRWTADDFRAGLDRINDMTVDLTRPVHAVLDFTDTQFLPHDLLGCVRSLDRMIPDAVDMVVLIDPPHYMASLLHIMMASGMRLDGRLHTARSFSAALDLIAERGAAA